MIVIMLNGAMIGRNDMGDRTQFIASSPFQTLVLLPLLLLIFLHFDMNPGIAYHIQKM